MIFSVYISETGFIGQKKERRDGVEFEDLLEAERVSGADSTGMIGP